jgi:hypothetical protein
MASKQSEESCSTEDETTTGKCSSSTRADLTGRPKTSERGLFRRGSSHLPRIRSKVPSGSSPRRPGCRFAGTFTPLLPVKQPGGKVVHAFAVEGDCDPASIKSNTVSIEWPPRSGRRQDFPEIDRGEWFGLEEASLKIGKGQTTLIDQLRVLLGKILGARRAR